MSATFWLLVGLFCALLVLLVVGYVARIPGVGAAASYAASVFSRYAVSAAALPPALARAGLSRFEPGAGATCADVRGACGGGPLYAARSAPGPAFRRTPAPPAEDPLGRLAAHSRRVRAEELDGLAGAPPARPSDREAAPAAPGLLATAYDGPRLEWAGPAPAATFVPDHYQLSL